MKYVHIPLMILLSIGFSGCGGGGSSNGTNPNESNTLSPVQFYGAWISSCIPYSLIFAPSSFYEDEIVNPWLREHLVISETSVSIVLTYYTDSTCTDGSSNNYELDYGGEVVSIGSNVTDDGYRFIEFLLKPEFGSSAIKRLANVDGVFYSVHRNAENYFLYGDATLYVFFDWYYTKI